MKTIASLVLVCLAFVETFGYPYYPYYGNMDTLSYGSSDNTRGGMVMSRYYNPYYNPRTAGGAGMAAFMFKQPEDQPHMSQEPQISNYHLPDRRRQTQLDFIPPQQNEVFYQTPELPENPEVQIPEKAITDATELAIPTEKIDIAPTTARAVAPVPEIVEPEVEEVEEPQQPKKRVSKKKQVKRPVEDTEDDEEYGPRMPTGAFFPMFFGYGRSAGAPSGPMAIANAYSTGRGGVATSHATAYGSPRPEYKLN